MRRRDDQGAAAVEFALICTILLPLLMGMLQYGLYFSDSLSARQGVRQTARTGVVHTFATCGTATAELDKLRCTLKSNVGALTGTTYGKIYAPSGWAKGSPLVVCTIVDSGAKALGIVPMPGSGLIRTKTQMSIEVASPAPAVLTSADAAPAGADWTWC